MDSDPGPDMAHVRQGGQPLCRCGMERGQGMDVGTGRIMTRSGLYLENPQRGTVRAARECTLPVKCLVLPEYQVFFSPGRRCSRIILHRTAGSEGADRGNPL